MPGIPEQHADIRLLEKAPRIHHIHIIAHLRNDAQVVADQQNARSRVAKPLHEPQNLGLHGDVERRSRLVRDEQPRLRNHGHGDHDALPEPARKLVRIAFGTLFSLGDTDILKDLQHALPCLGAGDLLMKAERFLHLLSHLHHRVETRHGLLKDHGDFISADGTQLFFGHGSHIFPVKDNFPGSYFAGLFYKPHDRTGGHALAAARLSDDTDDFAGGNGERNIIYCFDLPFVSEEAD